MKVSMLFVAAAVCGVALAPTAAVAVDSPGSVPSDESASGTPQTLGKGAGGTLNLFWSPSCTGMATNYAVYEGTLPIGGAYTHAALNCSVGNTTTANILPGAGSRYYLLVPETAVNEGVYEVQRTRAGDSRLIPPAPTACHSQLLTSCAVDECPGGDPSVGHCTTSGQCFPGTCEFSAGCTPSSCFCSFSGEWICDTDCNGHCI